MPLKSILLRFALATVTAGMVTAIAVAILTERRTPVGVPEILIPQSHSGPVRSLEWSRDGRLLASGGADAVLKIWEPESGKLLRTIAGHDDPVTVAGWSSDGQQLATALRNTIRLWSPLPGTLVRQAVEDAVRIKGPAWSPDGKFFAGIVDLEDGRGDLGAVRIWRADTGAVGATFGEHADYIHGVAWSPDSQSLAASGTVLKIWNAATGTVLPFRSLQTGAMHHTVVFSRDGKLLAEAGDYGLEIWKADVGKSLLQVHDNDGITSVSWSPDGRMLATGTWKNLKLRQADSGAVIRTFAGPEERVMAVAWSLDGRVVASSNWEGAVKLWRPETGTLLRNLASRPNSVFALSWSPDGKTIASGSRDRTVKLWQVSSGTLVRAMAGHTGDVLSLAWRGDGDMLASGSRDRTAKVWDVRSGTLVRTLAGTVSGVEAQPTYGDFNGVMVAWSPNGRTLAAQGFDEKKVKLWNPSTGELLRTLETPNSSVFSLSWSLDSGTLVSGGGSIQFWRADTGLLHAAGPLEHGTARYVTFRPDGKTLANVEYHGGIELLRLPVEFEASMVKGRETRYPSDAEAAAWSPDGHMLATAHDDGSVQLWDGDSLEPVRSLSGHAGYVRAVAWSPDGRKLASGGDDGTLRIWDTASGEVESITTLLADNEWLTVLPKTLLYSSSVHGDESAFIRFGTHWKELFRLGRKYYRRALQKAEVRKNRSDAAPQVKGDPWVVVRQVVNDPRVVRACAWMCGLLVLLAMALPWRSWPWWCAMGWVAGWVAGSAALVAWVVHEPRGTASSETRAVPAAMDKDAKPTDQAHKPRVNPRDGLPYVWVPAGSFQMGCSPGDRECRNDEKPEHQVTISKGFWMGQIPVTVAAYQRYANASGKNMPPDHDDQERKLNAAAGIDNLPVVGVMWDEAKEYCDWAWMRLPTEAEWEYAARAGSKGARYGELDEIAWYADNSGRQRINSAEAESGDYNAALRQNGNGVKLVGQKKPNAWGLYDMLGNVWQWTSDPYDAGYYAVSEKVDPKGPPDDGTRTDGFHIPAYSVMRGGSWFNTPSLVRVSIRNRDRTRRIENGFRCAGAFR